MTNRSITFLPNGGSIQDWTVPEYALPTGGTPDIQITAAGAAGSASQGAGHPGGKGGVVYSGFGVSTGDLLYVYVGLQGQISDGGWGLGTGGDGGSGGLSNGGGGGGSSGVVDHTDSDTLLIEGGGGGGGGSGYYQRGQFPDHSSGQGGYGGQTPQDGWDGVGEGSGGSGAGGTGGTGDGTAGAGGNSGTDFGAGGGGGGSSTDAGEGGASGGSGSTGNVGSGGGGEGGTSSLNESLRVGEANYFDGSNDATGYFNPATQLVQEVGSGSVTISWTEADAPLAPTLITPINNASADTWGSGVTFTWQYNASEDSGSQVKYALRIQNFGGPWYWWDGSDFSSTTEQWVSLTTDSVAISSALIVNNGPLLWEVATQEANFNLASPYSRGNILLTPTAPTVTITTPVGDTAILDPTFAWTHVLTNSPQVAYRVLVYALSTTEASDFTLPATISGSAYAGYLDDSGAQTSTDTFYAESDIPYDTGTVYVAYVAITQTGGSMSNWASSLFTADDLAPADPAICVVDITGDGTEVRIIVAGQDTNDLAGNCVVEVDYSSDSGGSYSPLASDQSMSAGQLYVKVHAITYTSASRWRAQLTSPAAGATTSDFVVCVPVVVAGGSANISVPSVSDTSIPVWVKKFSATERPVSQGVFDAIGNKNEIVISDVHRYRKGTITLVTQNNYERDVLIAYLEGPALLQFSRPQQGGTGYPAEVFNFLCTGVIGEDKPGRLNLVNPREVTFEFTEQDTTT